MNHSDSPITHVGYLGMGIMGSAMAANLLKAGLKVTVYNRTQSKCGPLEKAGATVASSPRDVVLAGAQVVFTNVTDSPDVEALLFGENGVTSAGDPGGLIIVDHSTISPIRTQEFARRLKESGAALLDAPVSGGDVGARNATLSISVGGNEAAFNRVLPVLQKVGRTITHVGPSGMGQVCKACNQIAVSVTLAGVCEAIAMAEKMGLDVKKMIQAVSGGAGGSWQMANLAPRIEAGDFAPGFMIDLMLKDLGIVDQAARDKGLELSATAAATAYFQKAQSIGAGKLGTQAVKKVIG